MTLAAKSVAYIVGQPGQPARREDVDLQKFVADDVEPDQEHAVADQFGAHHLGDAQHRGRHLDLAGRSGGMDVGADVALGRNAAKGCVFAVAHQRQAVHQEQAHVTGLGLREIDLRDEIAVAAGRLENLVEVGIGRAWRYGRRSCHPSLAAV